MTHLRRLGFADAAIFACHTLTTGQLLVPAVIEGEAATLLLATGLRLDVFLDYSYVEGHELRYEARDDWFGRAKTGEFVALGRQREHAIASVRSADRAWWKDDGTHAGDLGVLFFAHGVLAIDAAGPRVGFTTEDTIRAWPVAPDVRVPLMPEVQDRVPFTRAIALPTLDGGEATLRIDTGEPVSRLSTRYVRRAGNVKRATSALAAHAKGEPEPFQLALPGGRTLMQRMSLDDQPEERYEMWGVERCDGVLGMDWMRRWITVFDLPRGELLLWDYASLASPEPDPVALWEYVRGTPPPTAS
jgi:hypothetical protein